MRTICMVEQCQNHYPLMKIKIDEDFIKNYDKDNDKGYILEVDVENAKNLHDLHIDLPFLPERMKSYKCNKLVCNSMIKETMLFI